jgi:hypothetical protein
LSQISYSSERSLLPAGAASSTRTLTAVDDVCAWAEEIELDGLAEAMRKQKIDGEALQELYLVLCTSEGQFVSLVMQALTPCMGDALRFARRLRALYKS